MRLTLNMANVGGRFDPVPDGLYRVRAVSFEDKTTDPEKPWCYGMFTIVDGEFAEERDLSENFHFGRNSLWATKPKLEALSGMEWNLEEMDLDTDELIGLECFVVTEQAEYPKNDGTTGVKSEIVGWYALDNEPSELSFSLD